jgi:hypothetical protein
VGWDMIVLPTITVDADRVEFFQDCIKSAHKHKMQLLAGYALIAPAGQAPPPKFKAFNDWIKQKTLINPAVDAYAQSIVDFLDTELPGCDGVSFDIEGLSTGLPAGTAQNARIKECLRLGANIATFYGTLADKLTASNRLVAVATAGLTSRDHIQGSVPLDMFIIQGYDIAKGHSNILIRPMAYDNFGATVRDGNTLIKDWHQQIVDFAVNDKLNRAFQLGIRTTARDPKDKLGSFITDVNVIKDRCTSMLRADKNVGLILFPTSSGMWKDCDDALNPKPNTAAAGKFVGRPLQGPLDQNALDRLKK